MAGGARAGRARARARGDPGRGLVVVQAHRRSGARPLPRGAARRARRRRAPVLRRLLRDLRARQRRRDRRGALREPGASDLLPGAQRAGDGARRRRLCPDAEPARRARLHDLDRAGRDEHGHRRRPRDREPAAGAAAARRRLRVAPARSRAPAARGSVGRRRLGQRLLPAGLALLRPDLAAGAGRCRRRCRRCACSSTRPRPVR